LTTAERLEAITERGKFELLVTSVLRKDNRDYAAIIHTGINAQGETIKSPVDGFCQVPGSVPPRFLLVEHTTTDRDGLEKKWLYDHNTAKSTKVSPSDDGDLLKAGREAQKLRDDFPDAKFTVILTTNQRLPKGIELVNKVYRKAAELEVEVDIWEQSKLADFLDSTPEGQWLRKEYLGIEAEILSESLLRGLCEQSLANYEREFLTHPNSWVPREIDSQIEKAIHSNTYNIQFLIGESGSGKSAAAYQSLKKHLASGGYGLWVSDECERECTTFENLLDKALRHLYPSLLANAGRALLQLIPARSQLLLIVDDVNRADNPTKLVQKLVNWSKPQLSSTPNSRPIFLPCLVVCPVWSKNISSISPNFNETSWIDKVFIGSMNPVEAITAVQATTYDAGIEITKPEASYLATKLGNDPILIGLFSSLLSNTQPFELANFTENVIEQFITSSINESSNLGQFLENEYRAALSTLATHMLKHRKLYPLWTEIKDWLRESSDDLAALRELLGHKKLCRLTQEERFVFRHDRIQETFLVESIIKFMAQTNLNSDILWEPFYAEIIGRAIVKFPQNQSFLTELRNRLPLALVEAIRYFGTPTNDYQLAIVQEVKQWANSSVALCSVPESVLDAVCWSLWEIESPVVLEITETFPKYRLVLLTRLRNGCALSGVRYCINLNHRNDFAPFTEDSWRDQALEQARRYHKEKCVASLKQLLTSDTTYDEELAGALALAGFLRFTELEDAIAICWKKVSNKTKVLPCAIWAAVHCCGAAPQKLLDPLMAYWAELPDNKDEYGRSLKDWFLHLIRLPLSHGISDNVIKYLVNQCNVHNSLRWNIARICDLIDTPNAIELIVHTAANIERDIAGKNLFSPWVLEVENNWNGSLEKNKKLSQASLKRLKSIWKYLDNDDYLKRIAFRLWLTGIEFQQIDILRDISSTSVLFKTALRKRIELGDYSTVPILIPLLSTNIHWLSEVDHVWCEELLLAVEQFLENLKNERAHFFSDEWEEKDFIVSKLLMRIPVNDAEHLLVKNWDSLKHSPLFIQAALYIGTPKCLKIAAASINQCPRDINILEHIHYHCGFADFGERKPLTKEHLNNLLPYLDRLGKSELRECAEVCQKLGILEWSQKHLYTRLSEEDRKRFHPSDDDLLQELEEFATRENPVWQVIHWLEGFEKRLVTKNRALSIVDCWFAFNTTVKGLEIAAAYIQAIGTRKDLSILDQHTIEGSPDEIAKIKESTRFAVYRRSLD
jgi:hypothetical protein